MSLYHYEVKKIDGSNQALAAYKDKVILIVNTASKCGFTPQFAGLEKLYQTYKADGFVVLGFPCNQFLHQDPKSNADILDFCQLNYGVSFPMFAKVAVKGKNQDPLFQYLVEETGGKKIEWNFTKFLINRQGDTITRFKSKDLPESLDTTIKQLLA